MIRIVSWLAFFGIGFGCFRVSAQVTEAKIVSVNGVALTPGRVAEIPWPGLSKPLVIRLPEAYDTSRSWPVLMHYHGTNGEPTVFPMDAYAGRWFVIVGMGYATQGNPAQGMDTHKVEETLLQKVLTDIRGPLQIDPNRVYLSGFSLGGWMASRMAETSMARYAGVCVLGAGKSPRRDWEPRRFPGPRPVYVGAGQFDMNFAWSLQAVDFFKNLGGVVTMEDYPGLGHDMPKAGHGRDDELRLAPMLLEWFWREAHVPYPELLTKGASLWGRQRREQLDALTDPLLRYVTLRETMRSPLFPHLTKEQQAGFQGLNESLESAAAFAKEKEARSRWYAALGREFSRQGWDHARAMVDIYVAIDKDFPETWHGRRAKADACRMAEQTASLDRWNMPASDTRSRLEEELRTNPLPDLGKAALQEWFLQKAFLLPPTPLAAEDFEESLTRELEK